MSKRARLKKISASDAKNNFGGMLEDVMALGAVEIVKHGRLVAVMVSPRLFAAMQSQISAAVEPSGWGENHMIPPQIARAALIVREPRGFYEDEE